MIYSKKIILKNGKEALLRNGDEPDGREVYDVYNKTHAETDFMIVYPDENCFDPEREAIGKLGADGLFLVGVRGKDMGIAVKIEDGDVFTALYPVVISTLEQLGLLSAEEKKVLKDFSETPLLSDHGTVLGTVHPVFKLKRPQ